jgi:hypothetical protein
MNNETIRELFIEELAEVTGGSTDPLEKVKQFVKDTLGNSTTACCEEGQCCDYWA